MEPKCALALSATAVSQIAALLQTQLTVHQVEQAFTLWSALDITIATLAEENSKKRKHPRKAIAKVVNKTTGKDSVALKFGIDRWGASACMFLASANNLREGLFAKIVEKTQVYMKAQSSAGQRSTTVLDDLEDSDIGQAILADVSDAEDECKSPPSVFYINLTSPVQRLTAHLLNAAPDSESKSESPVVPVCHPFLLLPLCLLMDLVFSCCWPYLASSYYSPPPCIHIGSLDPLIFTWHVLEIAMPIICDPWIFKWYLSEIK